MLATLVWGRECSRQAPSSNTCTSLRFLTGDSNHAGSRTGLPFLRTAVQFNSPLINSIAK